MIRNIIVSSILDFLIEVFRCNSFYKSLVAVLYDGHPSNIFLILLPIYFLLHIHNISLLFSFNVSFINCDVSYENPIKVIIYIYIHPVANIIKVQHRTSYQHIYTIFHFYFHSMFHLLIIIFHIQVLFKL